MLGWDDEYECGVSSCAVWRVSYPPFFLSMRAKMLIARAGVTMSAKVIRRRFIRRCVMLLLLLPLMRLRLSVGAWGNGGFSFEREGRVIERAF